MVNNRTVMPEAYAGTWDCWLHKQLAKTNAMRIIFNLKINMVTDGLTKK